MHSHNLWHATLGNYQYMDHMTNNGYITYYKNDNNNCDICAQTKMTKKPLMTAHQL